MFCHQDVKDLRQIRERFRAEREAEQRKEAELKMLQHWKINNPHLRKVTPPDVRCGAKHLYNRPIPSLRLLSQNNELIIIRNKSIAFSIIGYHNRTNIKERCLHLLCTYICILPRLSRKGTAG